MAYRNSLTGSSPQDRTKTGILGVSSLFSCTHSSTNVKLSTIQRRVQMPNADESKSPPYMSFGVFKSTIEALSEITVPSGPLDRRVLHQLSGAAHGALMSGLSFLGYVDDERRATNTYRQLVESSKNEAEFKKRLLEVVSDKYAPIRS